MVARDVNLPPASSENSRHETQSSNDVEQPVVLIDERKGLGDDDVKTPLIPSDGQAATAIDSQGKYHHQVSYE